MKFISSKDLNKQKWNELVSKNDGKIFSYSYYFDSNSKNWGAFVNEDYSKGLAVAYNKIFGVKIIYPPIFGKYFEFFGLNSTEISELFLKIQSTFKIATFHTIENIEADFKKFKLQEKKFQIRDSSGKLNTLSKRMIRKAETNGIVILETPYEEILPIINAELIFKLKNIENGVYEKLEKLLHVLSEKKMLISKGIYENEKLVGGLCFCETKTEILYLTGVSEESARTNGGMYLCMNSLIEHSISENKIIDFGGSDIENIRRFYLSLGGIDVNYFSISWDFSPFWFKAIRKLSKFFKK